VVSTSISISISIIWGSMYLYGIWYMVYGIWYMYVYAGVVSIIDIHTHTRTKPSFVCLAALYVLRDATAQLRGAICHCHRYTI
jgi:hypothetical protein